MTEKLRLDKFPNVSFILSGVTGSATNLIGQHPSAGRLTETIILEPMEHDELALIVDSALAGTGVIITEDAKNSMIELAGRFPAPIHLLGYHAYRLDQDDKIDFADVETARDFIVQNIKKQDFQGRLDKLGGGLADDCLRVLAGAHTSGTTVKELAEQLSAAEGVIGGMLGDPLQLQPFVRRMGNRFVIAEPLFQIYLRWVFSRN